MCFKLPNTLVMIFYWCEDVKNTFVLKKDSTYGRNWEKYAFELLNTLAITLLSDLVLGLSKSGSASEITSAKRKRFILNMYGSSVSVRLKK